MNKIIKTWQERVTTLEAVPTAEQAYKMLQSEIDDLRAYIAELEARTASEATPAAPVVAEGWRNTMQGLLNIIETKICKHENTHRGGAIWTICDDCDMKWADDRGGFKTYVEPESVTAAYALLAAHPVAGSPAEASGNWPEDSQHENGNYENECSSCGRMFIGHKRRFTCKRCAEPMPASEAPTDMAEVMEEVLQARDNWPPFNSAHEGYAVLREEVDELWDHIKTNQQRRDLPAMRKEAKQVAAMALRFMSECCDETTGRK